MQACFYTYTHTHTHVCMCPDLFTHRKEILFPNDNPL